MKPHPTNTVGLVVEGDTEFYALPKLAKLIAGCPPLRAANLGGLARTMYFLRSSGADDYSTTYDTTVTGNFASPPKGAWSSFATDSSFGSMAFDGHYIYLLPTADFDLFTRLPTDSIAKRFDPAKTGSTETINLSKSFATTAAPIPGFGGGAFDGRYLYFAPAAAGLDTSGIAARYDTQADFTSAAAWSMFDLTTLWANA